MTHGVPVPDQEHRCADRGVAKSRHTAPAPDVSALEPGVSGRSASVIGSGIFTVTGTAAAGQARADQVDCFNATVLDLLLHGQRRGLHAGTARRRSGDHSYRSSWWRSRACSRALCYAELASMIPIAGSAYTYAYAILGEIFAWIIGWDLILEYAVANMSVAVGFSAYLQDLGDNISASIFPPRSRIRTVRGAGTPSGIFNLPALADHAGSDLGAGARRQGKRRSQHHDGADQDRGDRDSSASARRAPSTPPTGIPSRPTASPASLTRRVHRVLHLHRIRFRLHRGRGVPPSRSATCPSASSRR